MLQGSNASLGGWQKRVETRNPK